MTSFSTPLSSFLTLVLTLIILLSAVRSLTPATSRAASWREALTDIMANTVAEGHTDLFEAKVTHIHPTNTRFAAEFPTYSRLVATFHQLTGPALWHGRLLSLLFALIGLFTFYRILRLFGEDHFSPLLSTVLLALSNWLIIGTQVMPDVPAATIALLAVLCALHFLFLGNISWLLGAGLFTLLAGLTKLPSLIMLLWILLGLGKASKKRLVMLTAVLTIATIPALVYYFKWLPSLVEQGAMALMYPTKVSEGLHQVFISHRSDAVNMLLYRGWGGYVLSILGLFGSVWLLFFDKPDKRNVPHLALILLYVGSIGGLLLFSAKAGATLATHPYYAIPFLPLLAFGAASLIRRSPKPVWIYIICLVALFEISVRHFAKDKQGRAFAALSSQVADQLHDGPYISGYGLNPQPAYYFGRPTWAWTIDDINNAEYRNAAKQEGAKGIILGSSDTVRLSFPYSVVAANDRISIVSF